MNFLSSQSSHLFVYVAEMATEWNGMEYMYQQRLRADGLDMYDESDAQIGLVE